MRAANLVHIHGMHSNLPDDDTLYDALIRRDAAYDGHAFVGVTSTGVFCRLTCPARNPKRENTVFFDSIAASLAAGFRPCKRCKPLAQTGSRDPVVARLTALLDRDSGRRWTEADLIALGHDPSTVRRAFKRHFGMTFLEFARLRRIGRGMERLSSGASVIDAQLEASFESGSGFRAAMTRLLGHPPAETRGRPLLKGDWLDTPIGAMLAIADADRLHLLEFFDRRALPGQLARLQRATGAAVGIGRTRPIDQIDVELADYFAGRSTDFSTPLGALASSFTTSVWEALKAIPSGTTRSYSEIAAAIGRPAAVRAVARANGANQCAIVIPCHRVIGADGALTGYGGGLWRKRWLLEHERRMARQPAPTGPVCQA